MYTTNIVGLLTATVLVFLTSCTTPLRNPSPSTDGFLKTTNQLAAPAFGSVALVSEVKDKGKSDLFFCNAVAITTHWALTAGHCCKGDVFVLSSPEVMNRWQSGVAILTLGHDVQKATTCKKLVSGESKKTLEGLKTDLALVRVEQPFSLHVLPTKRLEHVFIVKNAPIVNLSAATVAKLFSLAPSKASVVVSQFVAPKRFINGQIVPLVAKVPILGFDTDLGLLALEPSTRDLIAMGTSGAGVFVDDAAGEKRLLAIVSGIFDYRDEVIITAVDVRPHAAWIESEMAKEP